MCHNSLDTVDSAEVGLAYDQVTSTLSDELLLEGLNSKPVWPMAYGLGQPYLCHLGHLSFFGQFF